jgi:hypothetical protein
MVASLTAPAMLASPERIPTDCPLRIPATKPVDSVIRTLQLRSPSELLRYLRADRAYRIPAGASILDCARQLHAKGDIAVLTVPFGSPARAWLEQRRKKTHASIRKAAEQEQEENEAEAAKEEKPPQIMNPSWVWLENPKQPGCEEKELQSAAMGELVWCKVETQSLMPGDSVTFTIFLKSGDGGQDTKLGTEIGRVGEGRKDEAAVCKWTVPEEAGGRELEAKKDKFYFLAKRYSIKGELKGPLLPLKPAFEPYRFSW